MIAFWNRKEPVSEPTVKLRPRDKKLLVTIHDVGGVLPLHHIQKLFFGGIDERFIRRRLSKLYRAGYLNRQSSTYWLGEQGADEVARAYAAATHRREGFAWRKKPNLKELTHDLAVVDFHLRVVEACEGNRHIKLTNWIHEWELHRYGTRVKVIDERGRAVYRRVVGDEYFEFEFEGRRWHFLHEHDTGSRREPNLTRYKLLPMAEYMRSPAFKEISGGKPGRWLWTAPTKRRLETIKGKVEYILKDDAKLFLFTVFDEAKPASIFAKPIWYQGGKQRSIRMFEG